MPLRCLTAIVMSDVAWREAESQGKVINECCKFGAWARVEADR